MQGDVADQPADQREVPTAQPGGERRRVLGALVHRSQQAALDVGPVRRVGIPILVAQTQLVRQLVDQMHRFGIHPPHRLIHRPVATRQVHRQMRGLPGATRSTVTCKRSPFGRR